MTVDKYLRVKQVAEITGLSRATIYNLEKAGAFPTKTALGPRAVAWRESEIVAWLESRKHAEKSEHEKRPGKPPTKKPKPIPPPVVNKAVSKKPQAKASDETQSLPKAATSADDDWSDDAPSADGQIDGWETIKRRKPAKVTLPNVGVLGRSSKEIPIDLNQPIQRYSKIVELTDFPSPQSPKKR